MPVDAGRPRVQHAGAGGRRAAPRPGSRFAGRAMCVCMHLTSIGVRGHRNQKSKACSSPAHISTPPGACFPALKHSITQRSAKALSGGRRLGSMAPAPLTLPVGATENSVR